MMRSLTSDFRPVIPALLLSTLLWLSIHAAESHDQESKEKTRRATIAIENVAVIDVIAGTVSQPRTVLVVDGRIDAINEPALAKIPGAALRVDGRGRYLMPGLVDMHVHLFNNATHRPPNDWAFPLFVANGVTSVREMNATLADFASIAAWRDRAERGELITPRVLAAGVAVRADSLDAVRAKVREARAAGANFIKIFSETPEPYWRAIVEETRAKQVPVSGHVPVAVSAVAAAKAGQRTVEHLTQVYEACSGKEKQFLFARRDLEPSRAVELRDNQEREVLESFDPQVCKEIATILSSTGQVQVPTLVLPHSEARADRKQFHDDPRWPSLRADEQARWQRIIEHEPADAYSLAARRWEVSRAIVGILRKAGVPILAGTDTPMPLVYSGSSLHDELELLVQSGLTPADALRAATISAADFLGLGDTYGSIAPGKRADLLILDNNPLRDIDSIRHIRYVILNGRVFDRAALDQLLTHKP
jgi:imidazolonepropionase-like amidohydrolase